MTMIAIAICALFTFLIGLLIGFLYGGRDAVSKQDAETWLKKAEDHIKLLQARLKDQGAQHAGWKRTKKWQHERLRLIHKEINVWLKGEAKK